MEKTLRVRLDGRRNLSLSRWVAGRVCRIVIPRSDMGRALFQSVQKSWIELQVYRPAAVRERHFANRAAFVHPGSVASRPNRSRLAQVHQIRGAFANGRRSTYPVGFLQHSRSGVPRYCHQAMYLPQALHAGYTTIADSGHNATRSGFYSRPRTPAGGIWTPPT